MARGVCKSTPLPPAMQRFFGRFIAERSVERWMEPLRQQTLDCHQGAGAKCRGTLVKKPTELGRVKANRASRPRLVAFKSRIDHLLDERSDR
jgi:hypothetical protein